MTLSLFLNGLTILAVSAAGFYGFLRLKRLEKRAKDLSLSLAKYEKEQSALVNADLLFSKKLNEINRQLVSMDNQLQTLLTKRENDGGYQHALRILQMGGDKEEIINSCHLSNAEAELLMNLNAYRVALEA